MKSRWFKNSTLLAALIGGTCTLAAAVLPLLLHRSTAAPLEIRGVEPIPQRATNRPEREHTTFRTLLYNAGNRPVAVSSIQCLPTSVQQRELPLAQPVGIAAMPHRDHHRLSLPEPAVGQPSTVTLGSLWIPPKSQAEVIVWLRCQDSRPGVRWLDMTATLTFAGDGVQATTPPIRVQAFLGGDVRRLASPGDLHLLR